MDVFEKTIEASGRGNFLEKRGEHPHVSPLPRIANALVPPFLPKIFVVTNPSSQFLQARNFKVEMLERVIPFDAGIVLPVPKNGGTRCRLFCTSDFRKGRGSSCR